jgi:hypothetical protein
LQVAFGVQVVVFAQRPWSPISFDDESFFSSTSFKVLFSLPFPVQVQVSSLPFNTLAGSLEPLTIPQQKRQPR